MKASRRGDRGAAARGRRRRHAARRRPRRDRDVPRAAEAGHQGRRRPAGHARRARDQERRRDRAAQPGGRHGRRRLPDDLRGAEAGHPRERHRRAWPTRCSTRWARTTSRRSTRSPASAATRIRTTSPTASSAPATRRSSTSSSPIRATAPATTARSTSAARRPPARRLQEGREWIDGAIALIKPGVTTDKVAAVWPKAEEFGFPTRWRPSACSSATASASRCTSGRSSRRLGRLDHPMEIKAGMVFALETYCPATDGYLRRAHRGGGRRHRQGLPGHHAVPGRGTADREPLLSGSGRSPPCRCRGGDGGEPRRPEAR